MEKKKRENIGRIIRAESTLEKKKSAYKTKRIKPPRIAAGPSNQQTNVRTLHVSGCSESKRVVAADAKAKYKNKQPPTDGKKF